MEPIAQKVRDESGKPHWEMPRPRPSEPKKWLHFQCPFCKGKSLDTAAINYDAQWFECFRCNKAFGAWGKSRPENDRRLVELLREYEPQMKRQVNIVMTKFGGWFAFSELWSRAMELIWTYGYRARGGPNDAGMLDDWEADNLGDPDRIKAYISKALYGDLMNYAETLAKWKRDHGLSHVPKDVVVDVAVANPKSPHEGPESALETFTKHGVRSDSMGWERDYLRAAENDRVAFGSWGTEILRCELNRNGLGPRKGHCEYCNRQLSGR